MFSVTANFLGLHISRSGSHTLACWLDCGGICCDAEGCCGMPSVGAQGVGATFDGAAGGSLGLSLGGSDGGAAGGVSTAGWSIDR